MPDWFTLEPLEDGSYVAMEDPMVKEMLAVFAERYGNMCCRVFKQWVQNWKIQNNGSFENQSKLR